MWTGLLESAIERRSNRCRVSELHIQPTVAVRMSLYARFQQNDRQSSQQHCNKCSDREPKADCPLRRFPIDTTAVDQFAYVPGDGIAQTRTCEGSFWSHAAPKACMVHVLVICNLHARFNLPFVCMYGLSLFSTALPACYSSLLTSDIRNYCAQRPYC